MAQDKCILTFVPSHLLLDTRCCFLTHSHLPTPSWAPLRGLQRTHWEERRYLSLNSSCLLGGVPLWVDKQRRMPPVHLDHSWAQQGWGINSFVCCKVKPGWEASEMWISRNNDYRRESSRPGDRAADKGKTQLGRVAQSGSSDPAQVPGPTCVLHRHGHWAYLLSVMSVRLSFPPTHVPP